MKEIAVVGLACEYPGASSPRDLWENVLARRRAFRALPDVRLSARDYHSADAADPDRTYLTTAAVLEGYTFDRVKFKISKNTFEQADLAHWLALDVASRALADAGFEGAAGLPRARTGVVFGNSLTGEFSRANIMRLRWPYVARTLDAVLAGRNVSPEDRRQISEAFEDVYKAPFPVPDADMLAGGLSNTIAGRITNYFDLGGGCFTVDGACSSSLLAIVEACRMLTTEEWDFAVVGGVDLSIDPFEIVGFSRNGALAKSDMRVFDARCEGFWPGEGCGAAVLVRREDAEARGLAVRALVRGWGLSSDGHGGLTRPKAETQRLAIERCYAMAGYAPHDVAYFEGHGTGTLVGDEVELRALGAALGRDGEARPFVPAIGSVKELIGHTKAAAGIAGFLKVCGALERGMLPPGRTTDSPHAVFGELDGVLRRSQDAELWDHDRPLRAGVSSMGFGGINVHVTVEAHRTTRRPRPLSATEARMMRSERDVELFPFAAPDLAALRAKLDALRAHVSSMSLAELGDLSAELCRARARGPHRLCLVARDAAALVARIDVVLAALHAGRAPATDVEQQIFYGEGRAGRVGLLFPGQGAPVRPSAGAVGALASPEVVARLSRVERRTGPADTSIAQPAITASSLVALDILGRLGVEGDVAVGHSLGELPALAWAGVISEDDVVAIASVRGRLMSEHGRAGGGMLALMAAPEVVEGLLAGTDAVIACHNGPSDVVVAGTRSSLATVASRAEGRGLRSVELPVSHAFHSLHMEGACAPLGAALREVCFSRPVRTVVSTISGRVVDAGDDVRALLVSQLVRPVLFERALEAAGEVALWIEVGPGDTLRRTLRRPSSTIVSIDVGSASVVGLSCALAAAYAVGAPVDLEALAESRFVRRIDVDRTRTFLASPCEAAPLAELSPRRMSAPAAGGASNAGTTHGAHGSERGEFARTRDGVEAALRHFIGEAAEIPSSSIRAGDRLLSDLHMNSLTVLEVMGRVSKAFALQDRDYARSVMKVHADGTIAALAEHLLGAVGASIDRPEVSAPVERTISLRALEPWVMTFAPDRAPLRPLTPITRVDGANEWHAFGVPASEAQAIGAALREDGLAVGNGVVLVTSGTAGREGVAAFLSAAALLRERVHLQSFVLVELGGEHATDSLAPAVRTLALELPSKRCTVVHLPRWSEGAARAVKTEVSVSRGYHEVELDAGGARHRPIFTPLFVEADAAHARLGASDVVLVTGGGKGITFASARHLARTTGVALAIVGRSSPATDTTLAANLAALEAEAIRHVYVAADVVTADLTGVVREAEARLGPITAVLHGAGTNKPVSIPSQSVERWASTRAPKVTGLERVLAALGDRPLRMLVTFGSIIGRSGMHGELDYALANEELGRSTEHYAARHPDCLAVCIEWSVWSGTGMGEDLGTIERLEAEGVSAIGVDAGLEVLSRLVSSRRRVPARVVVSSRYGALPTIALGRPGRPQPARFLESIVVHTPEVELVAEAGLSLDADPYLRDHVYRGHAVFPTVLAMEAMAQLATALVPDAKRFVFRGLRAERPILVPERGGARIRVHVLRRGPHTFSATLRSAESHYAVDCFRAELDVGGAEEERVWPHGSDPVERDRIAMDVDRQLYERVLFHAGEFRRIRAFSSIHRDRTVATLEVAETKAWFGPGLPQRLVLGCPGLNDAAIHGHQASVPQFSLLPVEIGRIVLAAPGVVGRFTLRTAELAFDAEHVTVDAQIVDDEGRAVQSWESMRLHRVQGADFDGPWPAPLLAPYLEHSAHGLFGDTAFRVRFGDARDGAPPISEVRGSVSALVVAVSKDAAAKHHAGRVPGAEVLAHLNGHASKGAISLAAVERLSMTAGPTAIREGWAVYELGARRSGGVIAVRALELDTGVSVLCVLAAD
ncbi:SDR family NAD(P)-dependent oxidoreductase [Myxococcota bacterium]|nr:SDR family NAD(P)-dependent oxidoreductase [Myxococcota bacterium]